MYFYKLLQGSKSAITMRPVSIETPSFIPSYTELPRFCQKKLSKSKKSGGHCFN